MSAGGENMERERRNRTAPRVLGLTKNYSKKELSLPEHGQYQKDAQVGSPGAKEIGGS